MKGLILFIFRNKRIEIYNRTDSYPCVLGISLLNFIIELIETETIYTFIRHMFSLEKKSEEHGTDAMSILQGIKNGDIDYVVEYRDYYDWKYVVNYDANAFLIEKSGLIIMNVPLRISCLESIKDSFEYMG